MNINVVDHPLVLLDPHDSYKASASVPIQERQAAHVAPVFEKPRWHHNWSSALPAGRLTNQVRTIIHALSPLVFECGIEFKEYRISMTMAQIRDYMLWSPDL